MLPDILALAKSLSGRTNRDGYRRVLGRMTFSRLVTPQLSSAPLLLFAPVHPPLLPISWPPPKEE